MDLLSFGLTSFVSFGTSYLTNGSAITKWLDALFYLKIGHKTIEEAENLKHQYELQRTNSTSVSMESLDAIQQQLMQVRDDQAKFQESVVKQLALIPDVNRKIPNRNIAAPIMDATESYIHDPEIRSMFATLLASSADSIKESMVRPAFVQIIKEMSPIDAKILSSLSAPVYPVAQLQSNEGNGSVTLQTNLFQNIPNFGSVDQVSSSLSNLKRLGLVEIVYDVHLSAEHAYDLLEQQIGLSVLKAKNPKIEIKHGVLEMTPIGKDFKQVVLI